MGLIECDEYFLKEYKKFNTLYVFSFEKLIFLLFSVASCH